MTELHGPWLLVATLLPLVGGLIAVRLEDAERARRWCVAVAGLTFASTLGAGIDYVLVGVTVARDRWSLPWLVVDELNAPLLPLTSLLYFLVTLATLRTKVRRFSFSWTMFSLAVVLATLSCREPWGVIGLLAVGTVPPYLELRARRKPTRVYLLHMGLFIALMAIGWTIVEVEGQGAHSAAAMQHSMWAVVPLLVAVLIRSGIAPFHCWVTDLFEHATFGTALLLVTPMLGAYAAVRLLLPVAPDWLLQNLGLLSLFTAVYAAGMSLVQREARRFFCYIFLSHSALVLAGLETLSPLGLTGALCVWLSAGLSLAGFGLALRALEARHGRLSLTGFHGTYEHTPTMAAFFLLMGMASVGFPGTFGFLATELLVDGAVHTYPLFGIAVVIAAALNGIAIVQVFFKLFTGARHVTTVSLRSRWPERLAILSLTGLILGGGLYPQPGVASRHHAAAAILAERTRNVPPLSPDNGNSFSLNPVADISASDRVNSH